MLHAVEQLLGVGGLDDPAGIHDDDSVGPPGDDTHVVGDEDDRHVQPLAEVVEQVQDLRLDGDVESRRGLVGDEQLRLAGQSQGDHHALAETAGELVGVVVEPLCGTGHAHEGEDLERPLPGLGL